MRAALVALVAVSTAAPALGAPLPATAATPASFLVVATSTVLPNGIAAQIDAAGGTITSTIPEIGVLVVASSATDFQVRSAAISGVRAVVPNIMVDWIDPTEAVLEESLNPPSTGDDDQGFALQWGLDAIDAPEAWNAGYRGGGVRVAVLDNGIASASPDLAPNLNVGLSTSFVPGEAFNFVGPGIYNHGTYVAGIIAAADNQYGTVGVAPSAEIVAVKVTSAITERGTWAAAVAGIVYAANIDADVINMSFSGRLWAHGYLSDNGTADPADDFFVTAREVAEVRNIMGRATTYAHQRGSTLIAAAGNGGVNFDETADRIQLPAMSPHVIAVSALAPEGWCRNPSTDLDVQASYTNLGQSVIDLAAPGGDNDFPDTSPCTVMTARGPITMSARSFDGVVSSAIPPRQVVYASGTSAAAPHVSGVAALIIGKYGTELSPADVQAVLRGSADDLGKSGKDDVYGAGRVNAFTAVTMEQLLQE